MPYIVRTVKGPGEDLPELKIKEHDRRKAPRTMPRPPFLAGMFGSRGAGKTTLLIQLIRWYDKYDAFDRFVVFSPTHKKDPKWEALEHSGLKGKLDLRERFDHKQFQEIKDEQEKALERYDEFKIAVAAYRKWTNHDGNTDKLTERELLALNEYDFSNPKDGEMFKHGRPSILVAFDDQIGNTDVYRGDCKGPVAEFTLRHRHFNCSIVFMAQVYQTGIPRGLRNNLSLMFFFANKSIALKKEVAEEMSKYVTPEQFIDMWTYATESDDHGSFVVSYDADRPEWRFRKNFNQLLMPASFGDGEEEEEPTVEERSDEGDALEEPPRKKK